MVLLRERERRDKFICKIEYVASPICELIKEEEPRLTPEVRGGKNFLSSVPIHLITSLSTSNSTTQEYGPLLSLYWNHIRFVASTLLSDLYAQWSGTKRSWRNLTRCLTSLSGDLVVTLWSSSLQPFSRTGDVKWSWTLKSHTVWHRPALAHHKKGKIYQNGDGAHTNNAKDLSRHFLSLTLDFYWNSSLFQLHLTLYYRRLAGSCSC